MSACESDRADGSENPFGYDRNDLHLDFFTSQIIKPELDAIMAKPFPAVEQWVFTAENDALFGAPDGVGADQVRCGTAGVRSTAAEVFS